MSTTPKLPSSGGAYTVTSEGRLEREQADPAGEPKAKATTKSKGRPEIIPDTETQSKGA